MTFSETKLRLFGPLVLFLVGTTFFRLDWYFDLPWISILKSDLIGLTAGYIFWELSRWLVRRLQRRYPGLLNTRVRIRWLLVALPFLVNLSWFVRLLFRIAAGESEFGRFKLSDYTYSIGIQLFYHLVYFVIYEGLYSMQQWKETYAQKEALKKAALQTQLDSLKNQINPHFLFNSLNILTALISENPRQAETFVDEISSVYRYLLRSNQQEMTTLRDELTFAESYFHLMKTRYGSGIELQNDVPASYLDYQLPPLTLQVLIENAVKHNIVLPEQPLRILLRVDNERLVVQNNLQRKQTKVASNQVGLANIAAKYNLIGRQTIGIRETDDSFVVSLPLLTASHLIVTE
ncbi:histidine kinase [Spirosoma taeanense]|uniref:Histidine kinase n=1 Tax=Spirosoma taeanense TaxID=2735870 RepID=A0A6M5YAB0_9BACT|nr:histidine kinase [Spirosoma taeanense]QJW90161.1 histidine kinase [Spirosoma taeanense]